VSHLVDAAEARSDVPAGLRRSFWTECARRAIAARLLAEHIENCPADDAFAAGLALENGLIHLMKESSTAIRWAKETRFMVGTERIEHERVLFGMSHMDAFVKLGRAWSLPENLLYVVATHHDMSRTHPPGAQDLCDVVRYADELAQCFVSKDTNTAIEQWVQRVAERMSCAPSALWEVANRTLELVGKTGKVLGVEVDGDATLESLCAADRTSDPSSMSREELVECTTQLVEENGELRQRVTALQQQLDQQLLIDPFTGLGNQRRFLDILAREVNHARAASTPLVMIMADLDCFTDINAHYGYSAGDELLKKVVEALKRVWRDGVEMARTGADSFAVLVRHDERGGRLIGERTRAAVEGVKLDQNGRRVRVTATVSGVSLESVDPAADHNSFFATLQRLHHASREQGVNNTYWQ
jgi:diguanylate cyclase (GGDEF)-like protein